MSNLFDPRVAAAKASAIGARGLPPAPPGARVRPQPNTQPLLPLQAPLAPPTQPTVANTPGGVLDVVRPGQNVPGAYKLAAYMRRGQPNQPPTQVEKQALKVLHNPDKEYDKAAPATKLLLARPGPNLAAAIQSDPELMAKHAVVLSKLAKEVTPPSATPSTVTTPQQQFAQSRQQQILAGQQREAQLNAQRGIRTGSLEQLGQQQEAAQAAGQAASPAGVHAPFLAPQDAQMMQAAGVVPFGGNLPTKLATETAQTLVGLGPGLVGTAIAGYHDPLGTLHQVGSELAHSYGETIHHPGRQIANDPLGFLMNAATPFQLGAGAAARGAELGRAAQLADAADISVPRQVAKTLIRPQPQTRRITAQYGEGPGLTITPTAYKSALGGYIQRGLDSLLNQRLKSTDPSVLAAPARGITNFLRMPANTTAAAARFGRKVREDFENTIRTRAGSFHAQGMDEGEALARARFTSFHDLWHSVYSAGASHADAPDDWVAIRKPPDTVKLRGTEWDSEAKLARKFNPGGMVASAAEVEKNPEAFTYVPREMVSSMKTYEPPKGSLATGLNVVNRGTQLIRSGRFMTPAYAQWAIQNGALHLSQAGPYIFRNAWQLKSQFPKLSKSVQGAIDGGMGGGIAHATSTPEEAMGLGGKADTLVNKLQGMWHNLDDRWARRMSAIHELNSAGYRNAAAWEKLYKENPQEFRRIVSGQAKHEAIDYNEMTPSERQVFAKLFTAYGWTRGATTYTGRFALQHPVQARVGEQIGQRGSQTVNEYYDKLWGMAPNWMRSYYPFGKAGAFGTEWLNPAGTAGGLLGEIPGLTRGQTENLMGEAAPIPAMAGEMITGANEFGTAYKGGERFTAPITEAVGRFKPIGVLNALRGAKKGGTFEQGAGQAAMKALGIPVETLRNPEQTAALGVKDYEQSLPTPDEIQFRHDWSLHMLPREIGLYQQKTGQAPPPQLISKLKGDLDAVEQRDMYQYHYANNHGAKSWKSLPATNKIAGTLDYLQAHQMISPVQSRMFRNVEQRLTSETQLEQLATELWHIGGTGMVANAWKSIVKEVKPHPPLKANP